MRGIAWIGAVVLGVSVLGCSGSDSPDAQPAGGAPPAAPSASVPPPAPAVPAASNNAAPAAPEVSNAEPPMDSGAVSGSGEEQATGASGEGNGVLRAVGGALKRSVMGGQKP